MDKSIKELISKDKNLKIEGLALDLGDSKSIISFVESFKKMNLPIHLLINNAGVMATPQQKTKDGYEYQFGINHLGHFVLTNLLLPIMIKTEGERRIVVVSSIGHEYGTKKN